MFWSLDKRGLLVVSALVVAIAWGRGLSALAQDATSPVCSRMLSELTRYRQGLTSTSDDYDQLSEQRKKLNSGDERLKGISRKMRTDVYWFNDTLRFYKFFLSSVRNDKCAPAAVIDQIDVDLSAFNGIVSGYVIINGAVLPNPAPDKFEKIEKY